MVTRCGVSVHLFWRCDSYTVAQADRHLDSFKQTDKCISCHLDNAVYLIVCWMKRSGSSAAKVARVVSAGTPSSKRMILGLDGKTGASLTSNTVIVTPAVEDRDEGIPLDK